MDKCLKSLKNNGKKPAQTFRKSLRRNGLGSLSLPMNHLMHSIDVRQGQFGEGSADAGSNQEAIHIREIRFDIGEINAAGIGQGMRADRVFHGDDFLNTWGNTGSFTRGGDHVHERHGFFGSCSRIPGRWLTFESHATKVQNIRVFFFAQSINIPSTSSAKWHMIIDGGIVRPETIGSRW